MNFARLLVTVAFLFVTPSPSSAQDFPTAADVETYVRAAHALMKEPGVGSLPVHVVATLNRMAASYDLDAVVPPASPPQHQRQPQPDTIGARVGYNHFAVYYRLGVYDRLIDWAWALPDGPAKAGALISVLTGLRQIHPDPSRTS